MQRRTILVSMAAPLLALSLAACQGNDQAKVATTGAPVVTSPVPGATTLSQGGSTLTSPTEPATAAPAITAVQASSTVVSEDTSSTVAVPSRSDPKIRAKVAKAYRDAWAPYDYLAEAAKNIGGDPVDFSDPTDNDIDNAINEACAPDDQNAAAWIALLFGQTLAEHGTDVAHFLADGKKLNDKVRSIVGC